MSEDERTVLANRARAATEQFREPSRPKKLLLSCPQCGRPAWKEEGATTISCSSCGGKGSSPPPSQEVMMGKTEVLGKTEVTGESILISTSPESSRSSARSTICYQVKGSSPITVVGTLAEGREVAKNVLGMVGLEMLVLYVNE